MGDAVSCSHYQRKCLLVAPCCNKQYGCRICHDEAESHKIDRYSVKELVCMQCDKLQQVSKNCSQCGILFGNYSCLKCRLFDDVDKEQFHCDGCGICRVGGKENFYHCPKCEMCLGVLVKDTHKCLEKSSQKDCPVCLEDIHTSRIPTHVPKCGHLIHRQCFEGMLQHGQASCPICNQTLVDLSSHWEELDFIISETPMPYIYQDYHVNILCRDCHKESNVLFHVIGLKCLECSSYNTTRIGGDEPIPEYTGDLSEPSLTQGDNDNESWQTVSDGSSSDDDDDDNIEDADVDVEEISTNNSMLQSGETQSEIVNIISPAENAETLISNVSLNSTDILHQNNELEETNTDDQLKQDVSATTDETTDSNAAASERTNSS